MEIEHTTSRGPVDRLPTAPRLLSSKEFKICYKLLQVHEEKKTFQKILSSYVLCLLFSFYLMYDHKSCIPKFSFLYGPSLERFLQI